MEWKVCLESSSRLPVFFAHACVLLRRRVISCVQRQRAGLLGGRCPATGTRLALTDAAAADLAAAAGAGWSHSAARVVDADPSVSRCLPGLWCCRAVQSVPWVSIGSFVGTSVTGAAAASRGLESWGLRFRHGIPVFSFHSVGFVWSVVITTTLGSFHSCGLDWLAVARARAVTCGYFPVICRVSHETV
jgi:hypothetical protein